MPWAQTTSQRREETFGGGGATHILTAVHAQRLDFLDGPLVLVGGVAICSRGKALDLCADGLEELRRVLRHLGGLIVY